MEALQRSNQSLKQCAKPRDVRRYPSSSLVCLAENRCGCELGHGHDEGHRFVQQDSIMVVLIEILYLSARCFPKSSILNNRPLYCLSNTVSYRK